MERTIKTEILEGDPHQTSAGASGMAWSSGTRLVVYEVYGNTVEDIEDGRRENGFYSYLDGVGEDGNFGETEDMDGSPFETAWQAEQAARDYFDETNEQAIGTSKLTDEVQKFEDAIALDHLAPK